MSVNSLFAPTTATNANTVANNAASAAANTASSSNSNNSGLVSATTFMQLMVQQLQNFTVLIYRKTCKRSGRISVLSKCCGSGSRGILSKIRKI